MEPRDDRRGDPEPIAAPPEEIAQLAAACVAYVEKAVGFRLDGTSETVPVLDHYLQGARGAAREQPELLHLICRVAGAYLGEVVRRRHASRWREPAEGMGWELDFEALPLTVRPVDLVRDALLEEEDGEAATGFLALDAADREAVARRLEDLPPVPEAEYYAPSTRLEVIDIAVDVIRAQRAARDEGEGEA